MYNVIRITLFLIVCIPVAMLFNCCEHPKDRYGREYEIREVCVTGHWYDHTSYIMVGKVMTPTYHHDWVVDTYTLDTIYYETRTVVGTEIYTK